jgi:hypothetical protein
LASTRSLKTLMNAVDMDTVDFEATANSKSMLFDIYVDKEREKEQEKEKLLAKHLKLEVIVDNEKVNEETTKESCGESTMNNKSIPETPEVSAVKSTQIMGSATQMSIFWDYNYMDVNSKKSTSDNKVASAAREATAATTVESKKVQHETLMDLTVPTCTGIKLPHLSTITEGDNNGNGEMPKNNLLTVETLEQTFNNDYYKLCFANLNQSTIFEQTKLHDDVTRDETSTDEDATNRTVNYTTNVNYTTTNVSINTIHVYEDPSPGGHLNETIVAAVREPFSFEKKDRLLARGPIEWLKRKANYSTLKANVPGVREKGVVILKDGLDYKVQRELGRGAFAKIYLIQNKEKATRFALKVNREFLLIFDSFWGYLFFY